MNGVKRCPKCGGEMIEGKRLVAYGGVTLAKKDNWFGDKIIPYYCRNCGYIELYKK